MIEKRYWLDADDKEDEELVREIMAKELIIINCFSSEELKKYRQNKTLQKYLKKLIDYVFDELDCDELIMEIMESEVNDFIGRGM